MLFKKLLSRFGDDIGELKADILPNLETHPRCPNFISIVHKSTYSNSQTEPAGLFTVKAKHLFDYLFKKGQSDHFQDIFMQWLENRNEIDDSIYPLSSNTIYQLNLGFFLDDIIEHEKPFSVFCTGCNTVYQPQDIEYKQAGGSWVTRHAYCPQKHEIFSQEVMHIMFKSGVARPMMTRVIKAGKF